MSAAIPRIYTRGPKRIIHVCAWCFPGLKIIETDPTLRLLHEEGRLEISHGICRKHKNELRKVAIPKGDVV
jgi:hypothetical protein